MIGSKHRFTITSLFLLEVIIVILFSGLGIIVHGSGSQPIGHYPLRNCIAYISITIHSSSKAIVMKYQQDKFMVESYQDIKVTALERLRTSGLQN